MNKRPRKARGPNHLPPDLISLMRLVESRQYADIERAARGVLARRRGDPLAQKVLSFALVGMWRYKEAIPLLESLARTQSHDAEIHNNLGIALAAQLRHQEATACFERALEIMPDDPEILKNLGAARANGKQWNQAVPWLLKSIEAHPGDYVEAISLLGACLMNANRIDEAAACYRELWSANPADAEALYQLIMCGLRRCDWQGLDQWPAVLRDRSADFSRPLDSPFVALAIPGYGSADHRNIAAAHARNAIAPHIYMAGAAWRPKDPAPGPRRLRIGYLSADLRYHPVGFVLPDLIERHDRAQFEVIAYSVGADDGSEIRARLVAAFDRFIDLEAVSIPQVVDRIRADDLDILVDLQGWTSDGRPEVFALRSARIQVNWLGYAGTMGHPQLADYLVGDAIVTPLEDGQHYTEVIAQMPNCYLPVDATRGIPPTPSRESQGLPAVAFVFCSLNNNFKFNPNNFDAWCRLLDATPDSVLWLSRPSDVAVENLKREVARRGIAPERLLFAMRVESPADHLARIQLADLALDPFPYNSHASGMDTLWAGVPMVTLLGDAFAGRVGASLVSSCGLAELVTHSVDDYVRLAMNLARSRARLAELRQRLARRQQWPLFDMAGFARDIESVYRTMWLQFERGVRAPIAAAPRR